MVFLLKHEKQEKWVLCQQNTRVMHHKNWACLFGKDLEVKRYRKINSPVLVNGGEKRISQKPFPSIPSYCLWYCSIPPWKRAGKVSWNDPCNICIDRLTARAAWSQIQGFDIKHVPPFETETSVKLMGLISVVSSKKKWIWKMLQIRCLGSDKKGAIGFFKWGQWHRR